MRDINAVSLKKLHYEAIYDHQAALELAYLYLFSDKIARDKYKALTYYNLYKKLSQTNPKPLKISEKGACATKAKQVETQLKASLSLDDNLEKTTKTKLRQAASTKNSRNIYGWFMAVRRTLSEINSFLLKINITGLSQVVDRVPFLGLILPIFEIGFELGIVAKNSLQRAYRDYQQGQGISPKNIAQEAKHSMKKDGRMGRILFTVMWLTIGITSMVVAAAAAPLLVFGMTVDLLLQFVKGAKSLSNLTKERQFIEQELQACKQEQVNYDATVSPLNPEEYNWLKCKESRLELRLEQLKIARSLEKAKIVSNVTMTSIILLGASLMLIPTPITSTLGLFIIATGTVGYLSLKLINTAIKNNYKTELAIPESEHNQTLATRNVTSNLTNEHGVAMSPDHIIRSLAATTEADCPVAHNTTNLQDTAPANQQPSNLSQQLVTLSIFHQQVESGANPSDNLAETNRFDMEKNFSNNKK